MSVASKYMEAVTAIDSFKKHIMKHNNLKEVHCMLYLNWSCTAVVSSSAQKMQAQLFQKYVSDDTEGHNLGVALMPIYAVRKGTLYKQES